MRTSQTVAWTAAEPSLIAVAHSVVASTRKPSRSPETSATLNGRDEWASPIIVISITIVPPSTSSDSDLAGSVDVMHSTLPPDIVVHTSTRRAT